MGILFLVLIGLGIAEAVVHLWRIRLAVSDDVLVCSLSAAMVCVLRGMWGLSVVEAAQHDTGALGVLVVYPCSVLLATACAKLYANRKGARCDCTG